MSKVFCGNPITQEKGRYSYMWAGLSKGKLLCIAGAMAKEYKAGNPLAYDIFREISNYFYDNDPAEYEYITRTYNLK
jgi:hypothetical protein